MKLKLLLLLSLFLTLATSCGGEDFSSNDEDTDTEERAENKGNEGSNGSDIMEPPAGDSRKASPPDQAQPAPPTPPSTPTGPCAAYIGPCANDNECSEKYFNCLKPKAGSPALTEQTTCVQEGQPDIILTLSEWNSPPGQNKLLCDFIEDNKYLIQFATNTKNTCRIFREQRKTELTNTGYECSNQ